MDVGFNPSDSRIKVVQARINTVHPRINAIEPPINPIELCTNIIELREDILYICLDLCDILLAGRGALDQGGSIFNGGDGLFHTTSVARSLTNTMREGCRTGCGARRAQGVPRATMTPCVLCGPNAVGRLVVVPPTVLVPVKLPPIGGRVPLVLFR